MISRTCKSTLLRQHSANEKKKRNAWLLKTLHPQASSVPLPFPRCQAPSGVQALGSSHVLSSSPCLLWILHLTAAHSLVPTPCLPACSRLPPELQSLFIAHLITWSPHTELPCPGAELLIRVHVPAARLLPSSVFLVSLFFGPFLWHMEVPRRGVKSELQLPTYTPATATLNPLSEARDRTRILMETSQVCYPLSHDETSLFGSLCP